MGLKTMLAGVLLATAAGPALAQAAFTQIGDYHMHIQGPAVTANIGHAKAKDPKFFEMLPDLMMHERTGKDVLAALDASGIRQGTLLSTAYMTASSWLGLAAADVPRLMREENRFNVEAGMASHGRLQAFISINPIAPNALDELAYWADRPGVEGLKLHLANSGFDTGSAADIAKLVAVFDFARVHKLPIVAHTRTKKAWSAKDVRILIEQVLPHVGNGMIQIAHCDTWAELDQASIDSLNVYADAIARHAPGTDHLTFDLSALFLNDKNDPEKLKAFVAAMRRVGLHRFVLASDWPAFVKPADYFKLLRSQLPLTAHEWQGLTRNEAPYFKHPRWVEARK